MSRRPKILVAVPLLLWAAHMCVVLFVLPQQRGEGQFIAAFMFFSASAALMLLCLPFALYGLYKHRTRFFLWAVLLNLSWLYYLKVLEYGPTVGFL